MHKNYLNYLISLLLKFRKQGISISEVNPITSLSDTIVDELYLNKSSTSIIEKCLSQLSKSYWDLQINNLRLQTGIDKSYKGLPSLKNIDIEKEIYRAVFTSHPVFSMTKKDSKNLCKNAEKNFKNTNKNIYACRKEITLKEEHNEALETIFNARKAISSLNKDILRNRINNSTPSWKEKLPLMLGVSSWVGYDLDGRSDIFWTDSFSLRLCEKEKSLNFYIKVLEGLKINELKKIVNRLQKELIYTKKDIISFNKIKNNSKDFSKIVNQFTERTNKFISSHKLANDIHEIAKKVSNTDDCISLMVIAADIMKHGFGVAEIHLRVNALQIHNAMSSELGWNSFNDSSLITARSLLDKLSEKLIKEKKWKINFRNLDEESAIAKRQLLLATQIFKHIDSDQPIRFLIAECEQSVTILSALFLAKKLGIDGKLDISPLFETRYGLEHGEQVIKNLLDQNIFIKYLKKRGRLSIQTGFSDAGRFIGQIAANFAIERLQLKIAEILYNKKDLKIDFLLFNTHGESIGRGGVQSDIRTRQSYIITPYVRHKISKMQLHLNHQTSFQGGDGFRLFGTIELAKSTIKNLFLSEFKKYNKFPVEDKFYKKSNFSLDFFIMLKNWHDNMFLNPAYNDLITIFSTNLLPVSGSRPLKRIEYKENTNRNPSKIRAITHNAILQQLGFLANVISGFGKSANVDINQFLDTYKSSNRLKQVLNHVIKGKSIGSLNTLLAYCKLIDAGFWVDKAYHEQQSDYKFAYRKIGEHLQNDKRSSRIRQLIWRLRDDLIDLYSITEKIGEKSIRNSGKERVNLDILHSIRIALIIESLVIICKIPKLSETNKFNNSDILSFGLLLDFKGVIDIVKNAFSINKSYVDNMKIKEEENYFSKGESNFNVMEKKIIKPLEKNYKLIQKITQLVSANHGAFG